MSFWCWVNFVDLDIVRGCGRSLDWKSVFEKGFGNRNDEFFAGKWIERRTGRRFTYGLITIGTGMVNKGKYWLLFLKEKSVFSKFFN